jgi:hypothetical protein
VAHTGVEAMPDLRIRLSGRRTRSGLSGLGTTGSGRAGLAWRGGRARLRPTGARSGGRTCRHAGRLASAARRSRTPRPNERGRAGAALGHDHPDSWVEPDGSHAHRSATIRRVTRGTSRDHRDDCRERSGDDRDRGVTYAVLRMCWSGHRS